MRFMVIVKANTNSEARVLPDEEIDFLKRALQHVEEERRLRAWGGGAASASKSRRNGKAARS